ncbi:hypothetical protein [Streptomyces sp. NPDC008240]|uniref:hypothetical protein n=1 Tax=Streptomyces sp. NPDC008240 TaxID=3364822 RepID=UPI0036EFFB61
MERVQGMWGPEGVGALVVTVVVVVAREWRRVQLARERRREREQELLSEMVVGVAGGDREVQVHHGGATGVWSLTGTVAGVSAGRREASGAGCAPVSGRAVAARRRR